MANPPDDRKADRARGAQETASRATGGARPAEKSSNPRTQNTATNASAKASTHPQSLVSVPLPFTTLGRYTVLREIGRGGMGAVYLAEDTMLKRQVALKIPQFEPSKAEQMQARFLREAQMAAQLSHPNICQTYDVAVIDGQYVMTMEYIEGKTLAAYAKPNKLLGSRQVVTLVRKVALAVEAAHQKGMIHRDLKPGNIILCRPDPTRKMVEPKVMDFGLAKSIAGGDIELTKSGMIVGTACYMSKEQWSGKEGKLGAVCDVFSLGVILYELLTGQLPYDVEDGEPPTSWLVKLMTEPQRRPSEHCRISMLHWNAS
jgi:serine/threonine protein kinase